MKLNELAIIGVAATTVVSCTPAKTEYASYELYPVRSGSLTEMEYTPAATQFTLWAPTADEVRLMLFEAGDGGHGSHSGGAGENYDVSYGKLRRYQ